MHGRPIWSEFLKGDEGIHVHKSEDLKSKSCKRDLTASKINTCKLKMLYNQMASVNLCLVLNVVLL